MVSNNEYSPLFMGETGVVVRIHTQHGPFSRDPDQLQDFVVVKLCDRDDNLVFLPEELRTYGHISRPIESYQHHTFDRGQ